MNSKHEELYNKIRHARRQEAENEAAKQRSLSGAGAFNVAVELAAGLLVGGLLGHYVDQFLHSAPWGLLICLLFGAGGGFYNVYKNSMKIYQNNKLNLEEKADE